MFKKMIFILLAITALAGCSKESPQIVNTQELYTSGGFIRGTVSGTRANGLAFSFPFEHLFYFEQDQLSYYEISDLYRMEMSRYPTGNPAMNGYSYLGFTLFSMTPPYGLDELTFDGELFGDIGNGQLFNFSAYVNNNTAAFSSVNVTNFFFDGASRTANGNFTVLVDGDDNLTGNPAVINGTFQSVPVLQVVSRSTNKVHIPLRPKD
ncbi:MAG: lipoprotein [Bacteroidota bacterium]